MNTSTESVSVYVPFFSGVSGSEDHRVMFGSVYLRLIRCGLTVVITGVNELSITEHQSEQSWVDVLSPEQTQSWNGTADGSLRVLQMKPSALHVDNIWLLPCLIRSVNNNKHLTQIVLCVGISQNHQQTWQRLCATGLDVRTLKCFGIKLLTNVGDRRQVHGVPRFSRWLLETHTRSTWHGKLKRLKKKDGWIWLPGVTRLSCSGSDQGPSDP